MEDFPTEVGGDGSRRGLGGVTASGKEGLKHRDPQFSHAALSPQSQRRLHSQHRKEGLDRAGSEKPFRRQDYNSVPKLKQRVWRRISPSVSAKRKKQFLILDKREPPFIPQRRKMGPERHWVTWD